MSDDSKSPKAFRKSISLLCHIIPTKWEVMVFLLTCVEVRICVFIHFLVLQNIVGDLGPNSWLNIHPLQGDHCAGGLYCWGQTKPKKGDREGWLFSSGIVWAPKESAGLKIKSTGFRLVSNPILIHQQAFVWTLAIHYTLSASTSLSIKQS